MKMSRFTLSMFLLFTLLACTEQERTSQELFFHGAFQGELVNDDIREASGLEASTTNPGLLWTHNDSGDEARIFLIHEDGRNAKTFYLKNTDNRDWEDIAVGPGPEEGKSYIYLAEIGDNNAVYEYKYIYRFEEPQLSDPKEIGETDIIRFQYPDGNRDAECLMIDPATRDLYIVSKREAKVHVYVARYPQPTGETLIPEKLGTLPFHKIIAGDISSDGSEIIMKTYDEVLYWKRKEEESIMQALSGPAVKIPYEREPQGEAIAWKADGTGFYTLSEEPGEKEAGVYFYKRK